ncbi:helix-turn-helix domain-containing protein [Paenibacillus sinopodophylli]|uniref:helix-turn-helix domain-containing protein n=1 Tax=Paenibacillus sinopodophylli TaxID=1837342 RepID=UPI00110CE4E1|nr:AraC family transcriptional regulator [Paenibacillus sinopodophylli]
MKKNLDLLKEHSIRAEYASDYSEKITLLMINLQDALLTLNLEAVRRLASNAEEIKDIKLLVEEEDVDVLKLYMASSISSFVSISIRNGLPKDVAEIMKKNLFKKIARCHKNIELTNCHIQFVEELIEAINRYSIKRYSSIVKMAIEYIHNNKFTFIYSKDVANATKVNRSYLSKKFSEEVGQTITDYIHRAKMELAIELMGSNLYHYNEIAELLGYANYPYFSKVFKKLYTKAPHAYMRDM